jgi:hypothetical protein
LTTFFWGGIGFKNSILFSISLFRIMKKGGEQKKGKGGEGILVVSVSEQSV